MLALEQGREAEGGLLSPAGSCWWVCSGAGRGEEPPSPSGGSPELHHVCAPFSEVSVGWIGWGCHLPMPRLPWGSRKEGVLWFQASLQGQGEAGGGILCEGQGAPSFKHVCSPDPQCRSGRSRPLLPALSAPLSPTQQHSCALRVKAATLRDSRGWAKGERKTGSLPVA